MPQDYSGQNLRGRSFKGQNLEGANFSYADIRSADFCGANLRRANFSHAQAGLESCWLIGLAISLFLLSVLSGLLISFTSLIIASLLSTNGTAVYIGTTTLGVLAIFFMIINRKGFGIALETGALTTSIIVVLAIGGTYTWSVVHISDAALILAGSVALAGSGTGTLILTLILTLIFIVYDYKLLILVLAGLVITTKVGFWAGAGAAGWAGASAGVEGEAWVSAYAVVIFIAVLTLSVYITWRVVTRDEKQKLIRDIAISITAIGGTSFCNADLTDVNFTQAILKTTNFRKAILTRTRFYQAKMLDFVNPGKTYLQYAQLQQLLVTGQGQDKNFDRQDLRGTNLQGANLVDASFIGADLSQANLQDADLSRAKLVQTQLNGTDLTGSNLTGAYIQDWGITTDTKFDGVRCEYVYMRLPTKENPDPLRKPDNHKEVFADGEFGDFIQPIFDTLDLYHNQGVDPRAIAISFKQLAENHPEADLRIVGMEVRGEDKFLLRAKSAAAADKSELSAEYFATYATYNEIRGLPEREIKLLLEEKDSRIRSLEIFVTQALQRPNFYSNTQIQEVGTMTNNPGGFSVDSSVRGDVNNVQGDNNKVVQGDGNMTGERNINTGGGNYNERIHGDYVQGNYYAAGQPQSLVEAAAEIQQLLEQLDKSYPSNTTTDKMTVAVETIKQIDANPDFAARILSALKAGGVSAFEQFLNHPAASFVIGALEDWQKSKGTQV